MSAPVPLIRRFTKIAGTSRTGLDLDEAWLSHGRGERFDWGHLRDHSRAVILADAGAGKTFELRAEAERLVDRGKIAFFIRIEDIDVSFGDAFEFGTRETFDQWLNGTGEAWFFLDSVDEVRLETPRAFETAMRVFASRVRNARQRAHIIISSRPYAWRSDLDSILIDELLPFAPIRSERSNGGENTEIRISATSSDGKLQLYHLAPLDQDQIRLFAGHRNVTDVDAFLDALTRHALYGLARLPFDLEDLIAIWKRTGALDSRLAVLEQGLRQRLGGSEATAMILPLDRALDGARRLALAMTLIGEANIRLPTEAGSGVNASALLVGWSPEEVHELLSRGIFSDALYSMVRFRHREVRELLAAQGLAEALRRSEARPCVEDLIFHEVYGEKVIVPRLRPLLPWLILFDPSIRDRALALRPEIAIEGGDPARLPLTNRVAFLRDIVAGIVSRANRGGDNSQIARIAQPDLEETVLSLLDIHIENDDVVFFLGRLVWQGNMREAARRLGSIAINSSRSIYARVVSVRAIMSVGEADQRDLLWTALHACAEPIPQRLLAEIVDDAPADIQSVEHIIELMGNMEAYVRLTATGLTQALHNLIDRLPMTSERAAGRPLEHFVTGLTTYLFREPFIHQGSDYRVSQEYAWLMSPAVHAVEKLVIGKSDASLGPAALDILTRAFALRHHGGLDDHDYKTKVGELVPRWIELNDALFWHGIVQVRGQQKPHTEPITDDWHIEWPGHFWHFDAASFFRTLDWVRARELPEDKSLALSRSYRTYAQNGRPRQWRYALWRSVKGSPALEAKLRFLFRPPANPDRSRWRADRNRWSRQRRSNEKTKAQAREAFVSRLKKQPQDIRCPPGLPPGNISWDQYDLINIIRKDELNFSRSGGNWEALIPEFGEAVAQAYRDAVLHQWRAYQPRLRSEGANGSQIPGALVFAMAGLEIEAGPDGRGLDALSDDDAKRATRYAFWEINGFPYWFEPLVRSHHDVTLELIRGEVLWEVAASSSDQPMHYIMHDILYHAPWLLTEIAELVRSSLMEHGAPSDDVLRHARAIMVGGGLTPESIAELARSRVDTPCTAKLHLPIWFSIWIDADPTTGIKALEIRLSSIERASATSFAEAFICNLTGDGMGGGETIGAWRTVGHLYDLYVLMYAHIRTAEDIDHGDGMAYSPTARDHAQRARDNLFNILASIPGEATYRAMRELAHNHPDVEHRSYMRQAAHNRATTDSEQTWNEQKARNALNSLFSFH